MKINYKNPQTGKPSSVVIPDIWIVAYEMSQGSRTPGHIDWPSIIRQNAELYFSDNPCNPPGTCPTTFTQYCEAVMACSIRCALAEGFNNAKK